MDQTNPRSEYAVYFAHAKALLWLNAKDQLPGWAQRLKTKNDGDADPANCIPSFGTLLSGNELCSLMVSVTLFIGQHLFFGPF
jgi:hypothetical protein